jgi:hypothetical protein
MIRLPSPPVPQRLGQIKQVEKEQPERAVAQEPADGVAAIVVVDKDVKGLRVDASGFEALSETGPIGYRRRGLIRAVAGFAEYPD